MFCPGCGIQVEEAGVQDGYGRIRRGAKVLLEQGNAGDYTLLDTLDGKRVAVYLDDMQPTLHPVPRFYRHRCTRQRRTNGRRNA